MGLMGEQEYWVKSVGPASAKSRDVWKWFLRDAVIMAMAAQHCGGLQYETMRASSERLGSVVPPDYETPSLLALSNCPK